MAALDEDSDEDDEIVLCHRVTTENSITVFSQPVAQWELMFAEDSDDDVSERKTIKGISVTDSRASSQRTFSELTTTSVSTAFSSTDTGEIRTTNSRDPDAMVIFDVHDTIRQIDLPKKRRAPPSGHSRAAKKMKAKNLEPDKISVVRGFHCKCGDRCGEKLTYEDIEAERQTYWSMDQTAQSFYRTWREYRKQYKCPKWSTFSKCSICTDIKFQMESGGGKEAKGTHHISFTDFFQDYCLGVSFRYDAPWRLYLERHSGMTL